MALKIAINGMGVIGREILRTLYGENGYEIVLINDINITGQNLVYLLTYDSIYHDGIKIFNNNITVKEENQQDVVIINGKSIPFFHEKDISELPLGDHGVDMVLECTGELGSKAKLYGFLGTGVRRVVACYRAGNEIPTIVHKVNQKTLKNNDYIISFPEMESQVTATILHIVNQKNTIIGGYAKAFRSFTNAQPTMDSFSTDYARGRAASCNITPVDDSFGKTIGLVIPELNGKINSCAYRSPVINGSIMDFSVLVKDSTTKEELNTFIKSKCIGKLEDSNENLGNDKVNSGYNENPLCSSDALGYDIPQFLASQTKIIALKDDDISIVHISVVYDNVRGYCNLLKSFLKWAIDNWL